ncbi:MAG: sigma-70 family RNA polymerase sigma factor [Planctomycetes bacterium]|nr:sigma-70 family RNA polymerase sigma factor [Planctomycetota bacterium]
MNVALDQLRKAVLMPFTAGLTDGQLLDRFVAGRDSAAFEALVLRHGPMVFGVCRRILRHQQDAEDAFQATFLVLVRRAAAVAPREMVGNWLYGVAQQTALKARSLTAKRHTREKVGAPMPEPQTCSETSSDDGWLELRPILDRELGRLPAKYRAPIVLCDLEGKIRKDAAQQLGWPEGTLSSRLARGRTLLARRLARQGFARSGLAVGGAAFVEAAFVEAVAHGATLVPVPAPLVIITIKAAGLMAAGKAAAGLISANVAALLEGALKTMLPSKLLIATAVLLAVGILGAGMAATIPDPAAPGPNPVDARQGKAPESEVLPAAPAVEFPGGGDDEKKGDEKRRPGKRETIVGSGKQTTKDLKIADFKKVSVSSAFSVEIRQDKKFSVSVSADDNIIDLIKAEKKDSTLEITMDTKNRGLSFHNTGPMKVSITMPALDEVHLTGATVANVEGFKSKNPFRAKVVGASGIKGEIEAGGIDLDLTGASTANLKGSAKDAKISVVGASNVKLGEFTLESANVKLSGASSATVNAKSKLDYSIHGASSLRYLGSPTIGKSEKSGASSASHIEGK